jgi:4-amino-4-deoxy-L-arabinose transferase-like glycosyltransferase
VISQMPNKVGGKNNTLLVWAGLVLVLVIAACLRYTVVTRSIVLFPYRADAAVYYNSAYNLRVHGVYSHDGHAVKIPGTTPAPDAFVTPGYPLLLTAFVDTLPNEGVFRTVALWQAVLGTFTVFLVFLFFNQLTRPWITLLVTLLVAISPHLVNATIYLLSETAFTFWLILACLTFSLHVRGTRWYYPALLLAGILFGIAALTRPVVELFPMLLIFLLCIGQPRLKAAKGAIAIVLGFLLIWGPWLIRNHVSMGHSGDSTVLVSTLHQGMYPGMMYQNDPHSLGVAYDFDPNFKSQNQSISTAGHAILQQFAQHPVQELYWYVIGKPVMLWSWSIIAGAGDIFIYPTYNSPYSTSTLFLLTHALMHGLHWLLVILALIGCIMVWLPYANRRLGETQKLVARITSLLLLYNTAVLMVLSPYVRYSIPFLPFEFGMALLAAYLFGHDLKVLRDRSLQKPSLLDTEIQ